MDVKMELEDVSRREVLRYKRGPYGSPFHFLDFSYGKGEAVSNEEDFSKPDEELDRELDTYEPSCGVAVSSELAETEGSVSISVKVKSNLQQRCRVAVFLVEDGIVATQIDDPDYVHDNVVRTVLSEGIYGDYLNGRIALYPGTEYEETYSADLPEAWNAGNMRVVAAVLVPTEDGSSYYADNVNSCPLAAGSSDYQIVK